MQVTRRLTEIKAVEKPEDRGIVVQIMESAYRSVLVIRDHISFVFKESYNFFSIITLFDSTEPKSSNFERIEPLLIAIDIPLLAGSNFLVRKSLYRQSRFFDRKE